MVVEPEFLTVSEVAARLGYSEQHTRLLLRQGKVRGAKIGRDWMILREAAAGYVARQETAPLFPTPKRGRPPGTSTKRGKRVSRSDAKPDD